VVNVSYDFEGERLAQQGTLQQKGARIFSEWLPSSNYELVDAPEISFTNYATNSTDVYSEIKIAVKAK